MMLLDLPPELLVLILIKLDPDSFYIALLVCKTIRYHARGSRALLHNQLDRLSGPRVCDGYSAENLLKTFKLRAHANLLDGADILTDVTCFKPGRAIHLQQSRVFRCCDEHTIAAIVDKKDATVRLYDCTDFSPRLRHILTPECLDVDEHVRFEALQIAFWNGRSSLICPDRISVLYRWKVLGEQSHPFVKDAAERAVNFLKLVTYNFFRTEAKIEHIQEIVRVPNQEPVGLAVGHDTIAVIAWQGSQLSTGPCQFIAYQRSQQVGLDAFSPGPVSKPFVLAGAYTNGEALPVLPVTNIKIIHRRLDIFFGGSPVPTWHLKRYDLKDSAIVSDGEFRAHDLDDDEDVQSFHCGSVGLPLAHEHVHHLKNSTTDETYCLNTALHITLDRRPGPAAGCYLLKSVHYPAECTRFDPTEKYASLEHRVVAKLEILDMHLQSSLGIIMAVSHDSRRIALATWDTVLVYALDPSAFLSREYCGLAADKGSDDNAYLEQCGHEFYGKSEEYENVVGLRPVQLPKSGVVFSLAFWGQDELWGLTDRGLVKWRFGARCNGSRKEMALLSLFLSCGNARGI